MTEKLLAKDIKKFLKDNKIHFEKQVSSVFNKSGKADLTITLPNGQLCYVELKGFKSKYQLSLLQKIFLLSNAKNCHCFYINSAETYQTFKDFITEQKWNIKTV